MMNKRPAPTSMGNKFHCFEEAGFPMSACVLRLFSHVPMSLTLCDLMDCSPRLLCPRDSPGQNTGVGCHVLLQGIFPTQKSNPSLMSPALAGRSLPLAPTGKPRVSHLSVHKKEHFKVSWSQCTFVFGTKSSTVAKRIWLSQWIGMYAGKVPLVFRRV